jgi:hypothetical protein
MSLLGDEFLLLSLNQSTEIIFSSVYTLSESENVHMIPDGVRVPIAAPKGFESKTWNHNAYSTPQMYNALQIIEEKHVMCPSPLE